MTDSSDVRIIHTGLYSDKAFDILDSMLGQLSDGKWENTPGYEKYWTNFDVRRQDDGEVVFAINSRGHSEWCGKWLNNPFYTTSDKDFKAWCARKIKAVIKDEIKYDDGIGTWRRANTNGTTFLSRKDDVTIADVYFVYEALLERNAYHKYDPDVAAGVVGSKRNDEETAMVKDTNDKIASIKKMYDSKRQALMEAKNQSIRKIEDEYHSSIYALNTEEELEIIKLKNSIHTA